jgi:hypothetical protein
MAERSQNEWRDGEAFRAGRSMGLAVGALALSAVSFLTLLGAEKAILAIVLGVFAAREAAPATPARRLAGGAVLLATLFLITLGVLLALYWNEAIELVQQLQKLS